MRCSPNLPTIRSERSLTNLPNASLTPTRTCEGAASLEPSRALPPKRNCSAALTTAARHEPSRRPIPPIRSIASRTMASSAALALISR